MKTVEQWIEVWKHPPLVGLEDVMTGSDLIESIQRDAWEAGAKQMRSDIYEEVYAQFCEPMGLNAGTPIVVRDMEPPPFPEAQRVRP